jgi:hypothetical protein
MPARTGRAVEQMVCAAYKRGDLSVAEVAAKHGLGVATVTRILERRGVARTRSTGPRNKIPVDEGFFERIDAPEKAYWLGFVAADGSVCRHKGGSLAFSLKLAVKDAGHLEAFKKAVGAAQPISFGESYSKKTKKHYPYCKIAIVRRRFAEGLLHVLPFPKMPQALVRHYLRGYFDGDGSWTTRRTQIAFSLRTATEELAHQLQEALVRACKVGRTKVGFNNGAYRLLYEGNAQCRRIYDFMYGAEGTRLQRKFVIAQQHLGSGLSMNDPQRLYACLAKVLS